MPDDLMQTVRQILVDPMVSVQRGVREITPETVVGWRENRTTNTIEPIRLRHLGSYFQQLIRTGHRRRVDQ